MGIAAPIVTLLVAATGISIGILSYCLLQDGELPSFPENQFWGPSARQGKKEDTSIKTFQINISEKVLTDLKTRLKLEVATLEERVADPVEGAQFRWGFTKKLLKRVQDYWLNRYDWRQREAQLNKYPHFKTSISGIEIHFQHVKPSQAQTQKKFRKGTRPLLLLHGWPGSFIEFQKLIPKLVEPQDSEINFELVIPSLPGFGFSEAASRQGLGPPEVAQILVKLMKRLGHDKFYVHGGDWGSIIAADMATMFKDNILGAHMTMCNSFHPRAVLKFGAVLAVPQLLLPAEEVATYSPLCAFLKNLATEAGYMYVQATKPETTGIALANSPSGLAAYILEKFSFWTNSDWLSKEDGGIFPHYDMDTLLDNVMVHWLAKVTPGYRLYTEYLNPMTSTHWPLERVPTMVPVACRNFPKEPLSHPKFVVEEKFQNLVRFSVSKTGGHFSAFELPNELAADVVTSLNLIESVGSRKQSESKQGKKNN